MWPEQLIRKLLHWLGIDRAVAYTLIGRGWSVLAGPVTLLFVARSLSPEEQGYYYTFANIVGLQMFFELGLSFVLLQFASHEQAHLQWVSGGRLEGDGESKNRLASLLRLSVRWYGIVALLVVVVILPVGLAFFSTHENLAPQLQWQLPWAWVVAASALTLFVSPFYAILEGCGLVPEVAFVRVIGAIIGTVTLWVALMLHTSLFAAAASGTAIVLWQIGWLTFRRREVFLDLRAGPRKPEGGISWRREIWPFQWKIAVSWLSGYFIFQLFNPVLFAYQGPVAAGQMGMSLTITGAISSMAMAWIGTKAAPFGNLVAQKRWEDLDRLFFRSLWQSLIAIFAAGLLFWCAAYYLTLIQHPLIRRIIEPLPLALLVASTVVNQATFAEAIYLRAHKQEPFLVMSIVGGITTGLSTYFFGRYVGATGIVAGYFFLSVFIGLPINTWIFLTKRREWHHP